jgi:alkylation response protein AidB-like acyl-CoA dehydrogenase
MDALLPVAAAAAGDAAAALPVADLAGQLLVGRPPGVVLTALQALGATDLTVARVVEPHLDALLIRREAGLPSTAGRYGVFAAEAPGRVLQAGQQDGGWLLDGIKPWCSLAALLDRALVTAHTPGGRRLFDVDLHHPGVDASASDWVARGLSTVTTSDVTFTAVPAQPVGADNWYLQRPGFAWGGIRVAACWAGGARALIGTLRAFLGARPQLDPLRLANLGAADVAGWSAERALDHAGAVIASGDARGGAAVLLAARTRAVVAGAAETVLREVGHALGPAALGFDATHARRVADLTIYVRQHHAERDLAALGELVVAEAPDGEGGIDR